MWLKIMNISQVNTKKDINTKISKPKVNTSETKTEQGVQQFSQKTSSACMSYGLARISFGGVQKVSNEPKVAQNGSKTVNLFYFSDTHGELTGLTKLASAKEACESYCGGKEHLTVLGAGDLIAGSQQPVIHATVDVVNSLGMEATAMGNHERSRSDEKLNSLNDKLVPDMLAINVSDKEKENCQIASSKILKQGDQEFIVVGARPLSPIERAEDIATAIDAEVGRIKEERKAEGKNENLPVVFLSHMGLFDDEMVAHKSSSVNVILGGHTHQVENVKVTSKAGNEVLILQGGQNNAHAQVVKMNVAADGTVTSDAKILDLKKDVTGICQEMEQFYGIDGKTDEALAAAKVGENVAVKALAENVGPKVDVVYVPEGEGYINDGLERNYSNPVSNIMADAMLSATADLGTQVSFFNAPSLKDTSIEDKQSLSNYDIMGRMLPFGGELTVADLPVDKMYEIIEERAQTATTMESQLCQVGGMVYSVDVEKAKDRYFGSIEIMKAEDDLKKAKENGGDVAKAEANLAKTRADYDALPKCVEKILILNADGTEIKINPKAIARGDYDGMTIRCVTNDFLAHETGIDANPDYNFQKTGKELTKVFEKELGEVRKYNDDVMHVDHNEVRISIKDKEGEINGYKIPTGINSKYWY